MGFCIHRPRWMRNEYWRSRRSKKQPVPADPVNDAETKKSGYKPGGVANGANLRPDTQETDDRDDSDADKVVRVHEVQHVGAMPLSPAFPTEAASAPHTAVNGNIITQEGAMEIEGVIKRYRRMQGSPEVFGASASGDRDDGTTHLLTPGSLKYDSTTLSDITGATPYVVVGDAGQSLQVAHADQQVMDAGKPHSEADDDNIAIQLDLAEETQAAPIPIYQAVRSQLWNAKKQSSHGPDNWFIPSVETKNIMRLEQVSSMLREFGFDIDDKERLALARRICDAPEPGRSQNGETPGREKKSYQVVLALLLMCKQHCLIRDFLDHGIDDGCLPLLQQRTGTAQFSLESHRNPGRKLAIFDGWPEDALDHFYRYQWQLIPTFFSKMDRKERKVPHYELRLNHILPYVHNPSKTRSLDGSDGEDRRGHFGQVSVYDLHPSQQLLHRYTVDGLNGLIAVKKLNSRNPQDFFNESDVLMRLSTTQKPTPHLARLLATYQQPSGPDIESMEFFLMFECAESNLERFWKRTPASLEEEFPALKGGYIARWVAMQCKGLADALATLHSLPKSQEQSDNNIPTRGLHGDIKPANILRYINWKDPANPKQPLSAPLGVLQLTDFGLSSIHHTDTVADVKMKVGASPYKPPETHLVMPISQSLDIWTLGCLYLDFLTWLVMGQEGQEKFVDKRRKHRGLSNDSHPCFFEVFEDKQGWTHVSISRAVLKWAQRLSKSKNTSQFVCDFVRFIVSEMLVIEDKMNLSDPPDPGQPAQASEEAPPSTRIEAAGLATILKGFIRDDMSYYTSVAKRPDLSTFNTPACVIKMKKTMQQATIEAEERHRRLRTHLQQVESQSSSHPDLPHAWSRHATERTDSTSSTL